MDILNALGDLLQLMCTHNNHPVLKTIAWLLCLLLVIAMVYSAWHTFGTAPTP